MDPERSIISNGLSSECGALSAGVLFYCINFRGKRPSKAAIKRSKEGLAFIFEKKKEKKRGEKKPHIEYLPLRNLGFSESAERKTKGEKIRNKS